MRGDTAEEAVLAAATALAREHAIHSDADLGPLFDAPPPDADPEVLKRLRQMYEAGGWVLVESAIADLPADLRWLFESQAVTLDQLASIHRVLDVTSAADLAAVIAEGTLRTVPGVDPNTESAIAAALPGLRSTIPRIPLGRATALAEPIVEQLRAAPGVVSATPAGSLRRGEDMVGDIEIVAPATDPAPVIALLLEAADGARCLHRSERRLYLLNDRMQIGIRLPEPARGGAALLNLTGSTAHLTALRARASAAGRRLTTAGLYSASGALLAAEHEEELYQSLGLPWIPPEIRNGDDEIEAAAKGRLPALVSRADIQGDLHMHTVWSDGRDSIETMIESCRTLGYRYAAITDHSPHSTASRNLTVDSVSRQAEEIAALRERWPDIAILHGCEVDILSDGKLDFPDSVLERFDIVLASLHDRAGHSNDQLMKRYIGAMRHPLVTLITHPTNRLVPSRRGYDLDYDRLFASAVETRTIVEIDGAPAHLDLPGALARRAIGAGATVAIDSDCHRADMLERQMLFGVTTARRGWVEPRHVLNTRSIEEIRAAIAAKRAGR
jgi:DNA polymerase (family 10)